MINKMDKYSIITLKKKGSSFRKIANELGIDRKTVSKIWHQYSSAKESLISSQGQLNSLEQDAITEQIIGDIKYDISNRNKVKLTLEIQKRIAELLEFENLKTKRLGNRHKQKLSGTQIHEILKEEGFDIGVTTVRNFIRSLKESRDTFIRQEYNFGDRLEYDFGEVKLWIQGKRQTFYLAVLTAPASGFRYAYLYKNQRQEVFLDSHVRFFEMMGGSYREVVYDNMKNVVTKFLPNGDKILNEACMNLALYYDFEINTTNVRKGNEKGSVENSVKVIRNQCFTKKYEFESYEEAHAHLEEELTKINESSLVKDEKASLNAYRPPYEIAEVEKARVNKYGCIRVENNFYSVPDHLMSHDVIVKKYHNKLLVYSNKSFVCEHKKIDGSGEYQLMMSHYLNTLATKPGALKHSVVLKQQPKLHDIYHTYFKSRTKEFIALLQKNKNKDIESIIESLKFNMINVETVPNKRDDEILNSSREQLKSLNQFMN